MIAGGPVSQAASEGAVVLDRYEVAGARHAAHVALERRLFEVVGAWVPSTPDPGAKLALRAISFHAAWRGELWQAVLPVGWGEEQITEAWPALGPLADVVEGAAQLGPAAERVAVVEGVFLAWLARRYVDERRLLTVAAGGPARRVLDLVVPSVDGDIGAASALGAASAGGAADAAVSSARRLIGNVGM